MTSEDYSTSHAQPRPVRRCPRTGQFLFTGRQREEIRRRRQAGEAMTAIARDYGVTPTAIWNVCHKVEVGRFHKLSRADRETVRAMRRAGATLKAIGDRFGVTPPAVRYWCRDIPSPKIVRADRKCDPAEAFRLFYELGVTQRAIAMRFGVTPERVCIAIKKHREFLAAQEKAA